jgi:hypothetical protein
LITVKPPETQDFEALNMIVAEMGLPYEAPKWNEAKVGAVILRDGVISSAVFLRQTAEAYLLVNPLLKLRKRELLGDLLILHKELVKPAQRAGFADLHCWLPPDLEARHFGRLLMHLGWTKPLWTSYSIKF